MFSIIFPLNDFQFSLWQKIYILLYELGAAPINHDIHFLLSSRLTLSLGFETLIFCIISLYSTSKSLENKNGVVGVVLLQKFNCCLFQRSINNVSQDLCHLISNNQFKRSTELKLLWESLYNVLHTYLFSLLMWYMTKRLSALITNLCTSEIPAH